MEKLDKKTLDEKAKILHENYSDNDCSFRTCLNEFNTVYNFSFKYCERVSWIKFKITCQDVFSVCLLKAIKSFDPGKGNFKGLLAKILINDLKKQLKSDKKQIAQKVGERIDEFGDKVKDYLYHENLDDDMIDKEGKVMGTKQEFIKDERVDVEKSFQTRSQLERVYLFLADLSINKKKEYAKKKTFCYPPLFFTDMITALQQNAAATDFISENQQKLDDAVELPFANHYLVRECSSVCDIRDNQYKPLSEFTGKESDKDKGCGNPKAGAFLLLDYNVYTTYILKTTSKAVTTSNISDHAKKFAGLMRDVLKEKGETLSE